MRIIVWMSLGNAHSGMFEILNRQYILVVTAYVGSTAYSRFFFDCMSNCLFMGIKVSTHH